MKYEWRKQDKEIYLPKNISIIDVPNMKYITITGTGNPNSEAFSEAIGALYGIAYPIKMNLKKQENNTDYNDYTVFPLEGYWDFTEVGRKKYLEGQQVTELKDYLQYKLMIRQPDYLTEDFFHQIKESVIQKKKDKIYQRVILEEIKEGNVCQYLHKGSYDDEPASFQLMEEYCANSGYKRITKQHKEIYITDARRVTPDKLKTTLRFQVEEL